MARPKKNADGQAEPRDDAESITQALIAELNKQAGERIAYNLSSDMTPSTIKRWISTGSTGLDYAISNRRGGGLPEGRIIEIYGPPSIGKSHIGAQICKSTQNMGGIAVYIDTENATNIENLQRLGIDIRTKFCFIETKCIETIFEKIEQIIKFTRNSKKDVPVTIIWDSIAASVAKSELEGKWDQQTIGVQARALSTGFKKITNIIGDNNILLVCLNQTRAKIGVMYGDPMVPAGGNALPYYASVRIKLGSGKQLGVEGEVVGINVSASVIKNKVSMPFRKTNFRIIFGKGIEEHEELFDVLREKSPIVKDDKEIGVYGTTQWKELIVKDIPTNQVLVNKKFYKGNFDDVMKEHKQWIDFLIDGALIKDTSVFVNEIAEMTENDDEEKADEGEQKESDTE